MQESMTSLKDSVNKVAVLASETSLYLTQNVERLTSEMKIYDQETQRLVESNLKAEREIKEQRIDETIELGAVTTKLEPAPASSARPTSSARKRSMSSIVPRYAETANKPSPGLVWRLVF